MKPSKTGARISVIMTTALAFCLGSAASAQSVDSVLRAESNRLDRQVQSQTRIDRIVSQTRSVTDEFRAVNKEIDGLKIYNQLLQAQVDRQNQKLSEIEVSMQNATAINRQILPLITRMSAGLKRSIELDIPFLLDERQGRLATLNALMTDPDVSAAEKFRKAMEAYQIEVDYGRTIEAYSDILEVDGKTLDVQFLRLGRVALLFQTSDGGVTGRYNPETRQFEIANEYRAEVTKGLQVATKKIAPELLLVPVNAGESN
ncbi:MAG: DUF3450 domain-containing protein [Pseudomonadota bacterium]